MKFGEFFGKYMLSTLVYSLISIGVFSAGMLGIGLYANHRKAKAEMETIDSDTFETEE